MSKWHQPGAVKVIDKWVNSSYPEEAGIIQELAAAGYDLYWSRANDEGSGSTCKVGSPCW